MSTCSPARPEVREPPRFGAQVGVAPQVGKLLLEPLVRRLDVGDAPHQGRRALPALPVEVDLPAELDGEEDAHGEEYDEPRHPCREAGDGGGGVASPAVGASGANSIPVISGKSSEAAKSVASRQPSCRIGWCHSERLCYRPRSNKCSVCRVR